MKTVTVREAQHNLAKILKSVESGETVEIVRRKTPVARLSPVPDPAAPSADWDGHGERLSAIWGSSQIAVIDETLDDLRGTR